MDIALEHFQQDLSLKMLRKFVIKRKVFFEIITLQIPDTDDKDRSIFTSGGDYQ